MAYNSCATTATSLSCCPQTCATGSPKPPRPFLLDVVDQLHLVAPVLRLLAACRRNQEIARELVVTLETVKKHTSHIFDELGAANRSQAVAHARTLWLIP
jgi:DNA-binding CsgD family transcriptional regulator